MFSHLTSFTNFIFFKIDFGKALNKFIFVELYNDIHVYMTESPMSQQTFIMHARKTSITTFIF